MKIKQAYHNKQVWLFNIWNNIEQVLYQQIIKVLYDLYLNALQNCQINTIDINISVILDYLLNNHWYINPAMLQHEDKNATGIFYQLINPVDIILQK